MRCYNPPAHSAFLAPSAGGWSGMQRTLLESTVLLWSKALSSKQTVQFPGNTRQSFLPQFSEQVFSEEMLPNTAYSCSGQNAVVLLEQSRELSVMWKMWGATGKVAIRSPGGWTLSSYSGLRALPPGWKGNVLCHPFSVLCCDVGRICAFGWTYKAVFYWCFCGRSRN